MLYSQMSREERKIVLDDPRNYPMRVSFLNKVGILCQEEVAFLRENQVDFDVDDSQVAEVLGEETVLAASARGAARPERPRFLTLLLDGLLAALLFRRGRR